MSVSATVVRFDIEFGGIPHGSMYIDLFDYSDEPPLVPAPVTVANFLNYVDDNWLNGGGGNRRYDGTLIHRSARVIPYDQTPTATSTVIQGGGFAYDPGLGDFPVNEGSSPEPEDDVETAPHIATDGPITNEFDSTRSNVRGTIAMARTSEVNSATSQWFINMMDNSAVLDTQNEGFTVFGQVLGHGMTVMDDINALRNVRYHLVPWFGELPVIGNINLITEESLITLAHVEIDPPGVLSPDLLEVDFGLVNVNDPPATLTVTLKNIGGQDIVIGAIGGAGGIGETDNLGAPFSFPQGAGDDNCSGQTLASRETCTLNVDFAPATYGDFQDSFSVPSDDVNQPDMVVNVIGTGFIVPATLDVVPTSLPYGNVGTGQAVETEVTVRNLGLGSLQLVGQQIAGPDASEFSIVDNTCNTDILELGDTCTLSVRLFSFTLGSLNAVLDVVAGADPGPGNQTVQLDISADVLLSQPVIQLPSSLTMPDTRFDTPTSRSVLIRNNGLDDLYVSAIDILPGADAALFGVLSQDCIDVPIAPRSFCSEEISFSPTVVGVYNAVLSVQSNDPDSLTTDVPITATASQDGDGIPDAIEVAAPGNGDGNGDGLADVLQENVASFPNKNGRYVTLETEAGRTLSNVRLMQNPSPGNTPTLNAGSLEFGQGFFAFEVENVPVGGSARVVMHLPNKYRATHYFMFGWRPLVPKDFFAPHWYEFVYDRATQAGPKFSPGRIVLNLVDGGYGDNDQSANGRISDPGGPALINVDGVGESSGGGGCSVLSQYRQSSGRSAVSLDFFILLAALMLLRGYGSVRTRFCRT